MNQERGSFGAFQSFSVLQSHDCFHPRLHKVWSEGTTVLRTMHLRKRLCTLRVCKCDSCIRPHSSGAIVTHLQCKWEGEVEGVRIGRVGVCSPCRRICRGEYERDAAPKGPDGRVHGKCYLFPRSGRLNFSLCCMHTVA